MLTNKAERRASSRLAGVALAATLGLGGCTPKATLDVKPIRVEPIHITVDLNVRVQREIDRAFDYLYGEAPATQPAAAGQ